MERLTERWGEDDVWVKDHDSVSAAHRLAAYEDTGLTPEQCENAKVIIESAFSDDTSKAERIRELLKADKAGCVVVLPCKAGDNVGKRLNGKNKKED